MEKKRKIGLDVLKIIAAIAVIGIHVTAYNWYDQSTQSFNWLINNGYNSIIRWSVPLFVMITGALF